MSQHTLSANIGEFNEETLFRRICMINGTAGYHQLTLPNPLSAQLLFVLCPRM